MLLVTTVTAGWAIYSGPGGGVYRRGTKGAVALPNDELKDRAHKLGIQTTYEDYKGDPRAVDDETIAALVELMEAGAGVALEPIRVRQGDPCALGAPSEVTLEDGTALGELRRLPADLPSGYHRATDEYGERLLLVGPSECYLPEGLRIWGWALQLYALRSTRSWGIGDLMDLREFGVWAKATGASMALINPLHAVDPVVPQENSPYSPGSRLWRNPLYLNVEHVAGSAGGVGGFEVLADAGRALNSSKIDRDAVFRLKMRAFQTLWSGATDDRAFKDFVEGDGGSLTGFATYNVLVEEFGAGWRQWPLEFRHPRSSSVESFREQHADRIGFHSWLQWLLDRQLEEASRDIGIVHDLAIGVGPDGADAWWWQDALATGTSVGAPPDDYNVDGQDWGVLGFDPNALARAHFEPFIQTVRSAMRHAGGIRFDHVMGLFRLYWVPEGFSADKGAYVTYPSDVLLDILALESQRARAYVIGEDLGTVAEGVREEMALRKMLSYKLLWFEEDDPREWPELSLAAATNHDLPTTAGLWTGTDAEVVRRLGRDPNEAFLDSMIEKLVGHTKVQRSAPVSEAVTRSYGAIARGSSAIATAQLEDALESTDRYNIPGTTGEWNWASPLPAPLEEVLADRRVVSLADQMSTHRPKMSS